MLSFNRIVKGMAYSVIAGFLAVLTACTVQPLYSGRTAGNSLSYNVMPDIHSKLSSIAIDSPADHMTQMVRNRLIYLLSGGAGQPASPAYQLTLNVNSYVRRAVRVNIGNDTDREGRASAGTVIATSNYVLKDIQGKLLLKRNRSITSSFDRPRQEYANLQAEQDAKKRAAEELAERIFLSLAQNFARQ